MNTQSVLAKKRIYICSPLRGDIENNIVRAKQFCRWVFELGGIPIAPHVAYAGILNDDIHEERQLALQAGLELVKICDELWHFEREISSGMNAEITLARGLSIPVRNIVSIPDYKKDMK